MNATGPALAWDPTADIVRSLVLYSLAEVQAGHATTIRVTLEPASFSVSDDGRGHAVDREVDGLPYLELVYTQLEFPFGRHPGPAVQLQGLGLSLVNRLCRALTVTVRKRGAVHRWVFAEGSRVHRERLEVEGATDQGNTLCGSVRAELSCGPPPVDELHRWLQGLVAATPGLTLEFNAVRVRADDEAGPAAPG